MLKSIKTMLKLFHENNIIYCHWKSNVNLETSLNGDEDLDIIFDSAQRNKIEMILNYCDVKRFRSTSHMKYNAIEDFIGFDKEQAKIWHLHLHYQLTLGEKHLKGYTIPWSGYILENRVYDEGYQIYRIHPKYEYFLLLLRIALKLRWRDFSKKISKDDLLEISWLKERVSNKEILNVADNLLGFDVSKEYKKLLNEDLIFKRKLYKLQKYTRKAMKNYTAYNRISSYFARTYREFLWLITGISRRLNLLSSKPKRRISPSGGLVVALVGSDGAGKSTTLEYLENEYKKKIDVKTVYLGSGDGSSSIIRLPMRIVANKVAGKGVGKAVNNEITDSNKNKLSFKSKLYMMSKFIWAVALALEKRKKLKLITRARNNGILVLTDRYPQVDSLGYNDGPLLYRYKNTDSRLLRKIAKWEDSIYKKAYLNPPDLLIKLIVPPELAVERKPEMTTDQVQAKITAVRKIALTYNSIEIDTSNAKNITYGKVMENIWGMI